MLCGNTWLSSAAMMDSQPAKVFSYPLIRTDMHGGHARCRLRCMLRVLAPTSGCLRFPTFPSKRMSSKCVETLTPRHLMKRVSHMFGGSYPYFAGGVVLWCAVGATEPL